MGARQNCPTQLTDCRSAAKGEVVPLPVVSKGSSGSHMGYRFADHDERAAVSMLDSRAASAIWRTRRPACEFRTEPSSQTEPVRY